MNLHLARIERKTYNLAIYLNILANNIKEGSGMDISSERNYAQ